MGFIERTVGNLMQDLGTSIRKFTAFIFLAFTVGVIAGVHAANYGDPFLIQMSYSIPLLLALASYFFTEFAIMFFIIFLIILILL